MRDKQDSHVPEGYRVDHYTPEYYHVRCPDCGSSEKTTEHPRTNSKDRCPRCDRARGVTPISPEPGHSDESDEQTAESTDEPATVTDGGMTDEKAAEYVERVAHSAEPALSEGELFMLDKVAGYLRESDEKDNSEQGNEESLFGDGGTGELVVVSEYADIAEVGELSRTQADEIARQLLQGGPVAVIEEWLVSEKDIDGLQMHPRILPCEILRETEKARLLASAGETDWYPKSCTVLFQLADDAELSIPQQRLASFEEGQA